MILARIFSKSNLNRQDEDEGKQAEHVTTKMQPCQLIAEVMNVQIQIKRDRESGWMIEATVKKERENPKILILAVAPVYDGNRQ